MTTTLGAAVRPDDPNDPSRPTDSTGSTDRDDPARGEPHPTGPPGTIRRTRSPQLFAGVWRWHFYASFLVVPVLALLAVTGLIYLFRFQLEPALHPDLMHLDPRPGVSAAAFDDQREVVEQALDRDGPAGAYVASMTEPRDATSPTRFTVTLPDESSRDYFVDPFRLEVLGSLDPDTTLSGTAVRLHADAMTGRVGDVVIELGACWAVVMSLTGYLLFVRGWRARRRAARQARSVRGRTTARVRQTHAVVGAVAGVALLGLLVSGLPWTGVWGEQVQRLATAGGTSLWSDDHGGASEPTTTMDESLPHSHATDVPWGLGQTERPTSDLGGYSGTVANLDTAALVADRTGLAHPYTTLLPTTPDGTFAVIGYAFDDPGQERTVHVDRYTGEVVATYGYADYSGVAKVVSQGIALHEGRRLGPVNLVLSAAMCLGILFLCVSGPVLWWRRRPRGAGRIGAPRGRMPLAATPALAMGLVVLGLILPLFGASLVLLLLLDRLVLRRVPRLARWFDVKA